MPKHTKKITPENNLYNGMPYGQRKPRSEMTPDELQAYTAYIRLIQQQNLSAAQKRKRRKIQKKKLK